MLFVRCHSAVVGAMALTLLFTALGAAQAPWAQSNAPASVSSPTAKVSTPGRQPKRQTKGKKGKRKPAQAQPAPQPVVQATPPPPPTPEQLPAMPPNVKYQNGELTILAQNSTLGDILHEVRAKTGAVIDIPPGANERVVGQMGPGPAREVLASLLNGTHFNYVMVASSTNPDSVAQVILTAKSGTPEATAPVAYQPPPNPYPNAVPQPQYVQQPPPDPNVQNDVPVEDQPQEGVEEQDTSQDNQPDEGAPEQVEGAGQQGPPQVKTPEQLLQELQRQQQLMQQQQQQQQQGQQPGQPQITYPQTPPDQQQPEQQPPDE
jgi:hypothetical protein